jgi:hypothetical protein
MRRHRNANQENPMRSTYLVVTVSLLTATAAFAAPKHSTPKGATPTYEACEALAMERDQWPGQGPSTTQDAQYNSFMRACLAGKIPLAAPVSKDSL